MTDNGQRFQKRETTLADRYEVLTSLTAIKELSAIAQLKRSATSAFPSP
jgi:hypothetical protein